MIRVLLIDTQLPEYLWPELFDTVLYLKNRSPNKAVRGMTPYKALHGSPKRQRKLKLRARKLRLIDYGKGTNQYKISQNSTIQTTTNWVTNRTQKITYPNIESVGALLLIFISTFLSYLPIIQHIDLLKPMEEQFSISQTLLTLSRPPMGTQSAVQNQKRNNQHIDIKYHYLRDQIRKGNTRLQRIPTNE
jgi:hypothetical protein